MPVVGIVLGFVALVLAILGIVAITIVRMIMGKEQGSYSELNADDAKFMQEMHQGLARMEKRIEALETILLERERTNQS